MWNVGEKYEDIMKYNEENKSSRIMSCSNILCKSKKQRKWMNDFFKEESCKGDRKENGDTFECWKSVSWT